MEDAKELNTQILKTTMLIRKQFPELSKYLLEMPETIPDVKNPEMNKQVLKEYLNSLKEILGKYAPNHTTTIQYILKLKQ
ncbi:hypothetical protein FNW52_18025 [Flavobacterium sp. ZT3R18]|uniref:hypothetical protein n=1 Tax=Flavobacterium sp. ZT3R18 TaxID=2594429 RepID=UPI00117A1149|nr:hypothetical protein [Flavobacterium sp. ZT3R18]TRX31890.1 hypothetical protein FNW52_18025 [Flavobacterium sp. ZT3R18]